jgi:hypothetical protein
MLSKLGVGNSGKKFKEILIHSISAQINTTFKTCSLMATTIMQEHQLEIILGDLIIANIEGKQFENIKIPTLNPRNLRRIW